MLRRRLTVIAFAMAPHYAASQARPDTTQRRDTLPAHVDTHRAWGGSASYEHPWSATFSSNFVAGAASAGPAAYQGSGTFERSDFLAANLLLRTSRYTTVGVEYVYGQRRNAGEASRHNQQAVLGLQVF